MKKIIEKFEVDRHIIKLRVNEMEEKEDKRRMDEKKARVANELAGSYKLQQDIKKIENVQDKEIDKILNHEHYKYLSKREEATKKVIFLIIINSSTKIT